MRKSRDNAITGSIQTLDAEDAVDAEETPYFGSAQALTLRTTAPSAATALSG
jgi:hypothetical protein